MLKKNHDRFGFSYSVPAQSGFVHAFISMLAILSDARISANDKETNKKIK